MVGHHWVCRAVSKTRFWCAGLIQAIKKWECSWKMHRPHIFIQLPWHCGVFIHEYLCALHLCGGISAVFRHAKGRKGAAGGSLQTLHPAGSCGCNTFSKGTQSTSGCLQGQGLGCGCWSWRQEQKFPSTLNSVQRLQPLPRALPGPGCGAASETAVASPEAVSVLSHIQAWHSGASRWARGPGGTI